MYALKRRNPYVWKWINSILLPEACIRVNSLIGASNFPSCTFIVINCLRDFRSQAPTFVMLWYCGIYSGEVGCLIGRRQLKSPIKWGFSFGLFGFCRWLNCEVGIQLIILTKISPFDRSGFENFSFHLDRSTDIVTKRLAHCVNGCSKNVCSYDSTADEGSSSHV